jgi:uncharacterized protein YkwD
MHMGARTVAARLARWLAQWLAQWLDFRFAGAISEDISLLHFMPALSRLPRTAPACLLAAALAAAAAAPSARARDGDELAALINAYRAAPGLCAGRAATPVAPLRPEAALSGVRIGFGTFLEPALKTAGYAAERAESISVTGPPDAQAAMTVLREKYCDKLLSKEFTAIGTAHRGKEWQVVLAHPHVLPPLPDPAQLGPELLALVNQARATPRNCGAQAFGAAPPLTWNETLARAALGHSRDMAEKRYFNHKEPGGSTPSVRATQAGYQWSRISENIASGQRTAAEAVAGWLDSPGHCANIMNPAVTEMGAAYAVNPASDSRTLYWTQMFGRPRGP